MSLTDSVVSLFPSSSSWDTYTAATGSATASAATWATLAAANAQAKRATTK